MVRIISAGTTDIGLRRTNNEDAFLVLTEAGLYVVADGMGGAAAGEVASGIFVQTAREVFSPVIPADEEQVFSLVQEVYRLANQRIIDHAMNNPADAGLGCTAELLTFFSDRYIIGHVGDSRIYLFRDGELRQLTKDHSLVQHQIDQGLISVEEGRTHALKNIVLRALGTDPALSLDIIRGRSQQADIFLLCSDGLSDMIEDNDIRSILDSPDVPEVKAQRLIDAAKAAGGRDNVTVVLCQVETT
jgi:protein phosphatase